MKRAEVRNDDLSGRLRTAIGGRGKQFLIRNKNEGIHKCGRVPPENMPVYKVFQIVINFQ